MSKATAQAPDTPVAGDAWAAAPFDPATAQSIRVLLQTLTPPQRLWLSGYLAGTVQGGGVLAVAPAATAAADATITILYGSQSGNCERIAGELAQLLAQSGLKHRVLDMLDCRKSDLQAASQLLVIVSTHGDGDPPDRAAGLYELLLSRKAPSLAHLQYAVLALGDSSYEKFCETGRQFDARLSALGAQPLQPRVECDVDFEADARAWIEAVTALLGSEQADRAALSLRGPERVLAAVATAYTRKNPFPAPVLVNQRLTMRDAQKDVRHIELALDDSGIHYEPGDALGVVVRNPAYRVERVLARLPYAADVSVEHESGASTLRDLLNVCDLGPVTRAFCTRYYERVGVPAPDADRPGDLACLLAECPPRALDPQQFIQLLRPLAPRLYSIASSPRATPDEVHLTVALAQFELEGTLHYGVASHRFTELDGDHAVAPVYVHRNPNFRLPADNSAPLIMIGPGTGIAPFRGFMAEREAVGAAGRHWLFYGGRHFRSDFLYQAEWLDYRKRGLLQRIEVAFSRDQAEKLYVQHRMREHGRELYAWLQEGAYLYVCGDAQRMAHDVHAALLEIIQQHGAVSREQAEERVVELQRARRYQRDVY